MYDNVSCVMETGRRVDQDRKCTVHVSIDVHLGYVIVYWGGLDPDTLPDAAAWGVEDVARTCPSVLGSVTRRMMASHGESVSQSG